MQNDRHCVLASMCSSDQAYLTRVRYPGGVNLIFILLLLIALFGPWTYAEIYNQLSKWTTTFMNTVNLSQSHWFTGANNINTDTKQN